MLSIIAPGISLVDAIPVAFPLCLDHFDLPEGVELESFVADHMGEVPLLNAFLVVVVLQLLELVAERHVHFFEGVVDLILERGGDALDVGVLNDVLLQVSEDDPKLLHQLLVQPLRLVLQVVQFVLLVFYLVLLLKNDLLLAEQLVLGVDNGACQCSQRRH